MEARVEAWIVSLSVGIWGALLKTTIHCVHGRKVLFSGLFGLGKPFRTARKTQIVQPTGQIVQPHEEEGRSIRLLAGSGLLAEAEPIDEGTYAEGRSDHGKERDAIPLRGGAYGTEATRDSFTPPRTYERKDHR